MSGTSLKEPMDGGDAPRMAGPELSVVVPVHNESENVVPLILEVLAALDGQFDFELIYVDDCSDDATPDLLADALGRFPRLRVLRHRARTGQSAALATGIEAARGRTIATLDGDGQNDPADIAALVKQLQESPDPDRLLVAGHRARRRDTWVKRLSSRVANGVRRALLGDGTPDTGCGLKVFTRTAFLAMPRFDHMHRFLPALMLRAGGTVVSVPVNHRHRTKGRTKYGVFDRLWVGLFDLIGVMWLQRRRIVPTADEIAAKRD
ncbi:glycosyltransferase family 2 protein [Shumkonia mesophila]|uniref:glycosyltransferase family 2 protein n=1 Tax=Shumkonia mesophila TaxID=2838854 RepID=UPI002934D55D|nr:glycosyltransferase family 2 protein [Shumkonia mesophila]